MAKWTPILFTGVCAAGLSALLYFAQLTASQSIPAYSTLSSKPDGAKILFDGLANSGIVQTSRQFKTVSLQKPHGAMVFFLGVEPITLKFQEQAYFDEMEAAAIAGNQLIIAVVDGPIFKLGGKALEQRWGVLFFTPSLTVDKNWQPRPDIGPAVWQRNFGKGSIILVGNAQRLSNKSIATDQASRVLLRKLVGGRQSVIFEEAHLGITETGSVAGLARRYRLQGLMAGLVLLAALFIWSRSVGFPPPSFISEKVLLGSDTRSMLSELMSRHLKGQLIQTCVAEWNRTRAHAPAIQVPEEVSPIDAYVKLQKSLDRQTRC